MGFSGRNACRALMHRDRRPGSLRGHADTLDRSARAVPVRHRRGDVRRNSGKGQGISGRRRADFQHARGGSESDRRFQPLGVNVAGRCRVRLGQADDQMGKELQSIEPLALQGGHDAQPAVPLVLRRLFAAIPVRLDPLGEAAARPAAHLRRDAPAVVALAGKGLNLARRAASRHARGHGQTDGESTPCRQGDQSRDFPPEHGGSLERRGRPRKSPPAWAASRSYEADSANFRLFRRRVTVGVLPVSQARNHLDTCK